MADTTGQTRREARHAAKAAKVEARAEQERQRATAEAEAAFWASPQGQARAARHANQQLFQITLPLTVTERTLSAVFSGDKAHAPNRLRRARDRARSDRGRGEWHLEHAGYVFEQTGMVSRDKLMSTGQVASVAGQIVGTYIFRAHRDAPTV